jgi:TolC family type I secretion outer membrane protein
MFTPRVFLVALSFFLCASTQADDFLSLYREALTADATFLTTQADTRGRRELLPQARAQLLPNLSISGSRSRNSTEQRSQEYFAPVKNEYDYDSYNYALTLRQPIFRPYNIAAYFQSRSQVESADASLRWAAQEAAMRVGAAYFDVLLAESEIDVNLRQQEAYRAQMDFSQKAFVSGAGTRTEIDEAQSRLDLAKAEAIELRYRLNYAQESLSSIVNRPISHLARLDPARMRLLPPDPGRLEDWLHTTETANPYLESLRANVKAAQQEIWKSRSGHLPTVDLVAQRSKSQSESNTSIGNKYNTKMVGIQVNIPVFSGGYVNSTVRQAYAELEKAEQQQEAGRREIHLNVRREFDAVSQGVHWVNAYSQAVASAERALYSTKKGFQAGRRSTLDILAAEHNLAVAQRDLNRGRYQYVVAYLRLFALAGRLNEDEIQKINAWLKQ